MATSTCLNCGGTQFEVVEQEPVGSDFKVVFVQCAKCGGVVGTLDAINPGYWSLKIAEKLGIGPES